MLILFAAIKIGFGRFGYTALIAHAFFFGFLHCELFLIVKIRSDYITGITILDDLTFIEP